jgi:PAS domain S-box-containing protein
MKLKLKSEDKILKQQRWIVKIKENREVFIVVGTIIILGIIIWLNEVLDIPHYLFGAPLTPINWREALFLSILLTSAGIIAVTIIKRFVSQRKQSENALQRSEEEYRILVENSNEIIYSIDQNFRLISVVGDPLLATGFTIEELKKMTSRKLFHFLHPKDRSFFLRHLQSCLSKGQSDTFQFRIRDKKGDYRWIETDLTPVKSGKKKAIGIRGISRDITERKSMSDRIKESEEKFRDLFENASDAIWTADTKGRYISVNRQFRNLLGFKKEELIGKKSIYLVAPESREKSIENYKKTLAGKSTEYEVTVLNKKGERRIHLERLRSLREKDRIVGVQGIGRDITERKQNEKLQGVLYNISKAANSPISLKELYPLIHKELGTIIDTTNFYIALVDEKEDKIFFPYHQDEKDDSFTPQKLSSNNTVTTHVIKTSQPFLINREQLNGMVAQEILALQGTMTDNSVWLGVPLKIEDRVIGAMASNS